MIWMPAFQIGNDEEVIYESLPVCQYLDDTYPGSRTLSPMQPKEKAYEAMFLAHFDQVTNFIMLIELHLLSNLVFQVIRQFYKFFRSDNSQESLQRFQASLLFMELTLKRKRNSSPFLGLQEQQQQNAKPGMIDYMIWPWFERMDVISLLLPHIADPLPPSDFPLTVSLITVIPFCIGDDPFLFEL